MISFYNKLKSGVDLADMDISIYHRKRKAKKIVEIIILLFTRYAFS